MTIVADLLILAGAVLTLLAAVGVHQFDDVFSRIHAAGKAPSLGIILIVVGTSLRVSDPASIAKLLTALALLLITGPVGVHLMARAVYRAGGELSETTIVDERLDGELRRPRRRR